MTQVEQQTGRALALRSRDVRAYDNSGARVMMGVLQQRSLYGFYQILTHEGFGSRRDQLTLFSNPGFSAIADIVATDLRTGIDTRAPEAVAENRFTLALLMNFLNFSQLSDATQLELRSKLIPANFSLVRDTEHLIIGEREHAAQERRLLQLSENAEANFLTAINDGAVVTVNDVFAASMVGERPAAICTRTFTTPDGTTFIEGNWYAPLEQFGTANALTNAVNAGEKNINLARGSWQLLRGVHGYETNIVDPLIKII